MPAKTALVTGGCGFVGRRVVHALLRRDYEVTIVDNLSTGLHPAEWPAHLRLAGNAPVIFHHGDIRDFIKESAPGYELLCHLAAVVGGRLTIDGDPLAVASDLAIDADFFHWITGNIRPVKVLYFSSSAAYPIALQQAENHCRLSEDMISFRNSIGLPDMTYGWAKLTGEFLAGFAVARYGLDVVIFRPFSGYGEDQDRTYPFPSIVQRVLNLESPVGVWGSGEQLRDFIYVDDAVEAALLSMNHLLPGQALNLGSGVGTSFRSLAETICDVLGHSSVVVNDSSKPEGVFARVGDCRRMREWYTPRVSLAEGISRTHRYLSELTPRHAGVQG